MKTQIKLLRNLLFFGFLSSGIIFCSKNPEQNLNPTNFSGKIIEMTCGGTVIQFINTDSLIGETWLDFFGYNNIQYTNCVLNGDIGKPFKKGDTVLFNFKKVTSLTGSGPFCDIGGLPQTIIQCFDVTK